MLQQLYSPPTKTSPDSTWRQHTSAAPETYNHFYYIYMNMSKASGFLQYLPDECPAERRPGLLPENIELSDV